MIKTATIITTHRPKFKYAKTFLEKFHQYVKKPHPLYFVFSNENESEEFDKIVQLDCIKLVIPSRLQRPIEIPPGGNYGGIVNIKKFFALNEIFDEYDFIGVYDCDSEIVKYVDFDEVYPDIFNSRTLKCNKSRQGANVIKNTAEKMGMFTSKIQEITDREMYWWFNEIPVYEKHSFKRFYEWFTALKNIEDIMQDYWCFDYIMYGIWLLTHENFTIKTFDSTNLWGALEDLNMSQNDKIEIVKLFNSYWCADLHTHANFDNIKIIIHSDTRPVKNV
jgi:hypothetical protein